MSRLFRIIVVSIFIFSLLCSSLYAADFAPIFPIQASPVVAPPNFTWAAGDYDYFILYVLLPIPIPDYWYTPIQIPRYQKPYWKCADTLWGYLLKDRWCLWRVLGYNTSTKEYEVSPWQVFEKVEDCVVEFPDPILEEMVRRSLNKPIGDILASELSTIPSFHLSIYPQEITDISGLEYFVNLEELGIVTNTIMDLSPLAGLTNLYYLNLYSNQISDLSPLAGLTNLQELYLFDNQINDISPLAGLTNLYNLSLDGNQISDLSPLAGLIGMGNLYLSNNQISDLSPLAGLTNLQELYLFVNQINDISPLAGLTGLERLDLHTNQIGDLSPLAGLTSLELVDLDGNQISDLSPLAGPVAPETLRLEQNLISDISPLVENLGLVGWNFDVYLRGNPLSSASCTVYIPELEDRYVTVIDDCP